MKEAGKTLGMTPPISLVKSKMSALEYTRELEDYLWQADMYETEDDLNQRYEVLWKLKNLFTGWIKEVCTKSKNVPPETAETVGGKICTFGSYRLGVSGKGADIDTLCVAPKYIEHTDFFTSFY
ncbi:hypothetical protein Pcinc_000846 [Petrolisthes cinctipes]|uniref:Poly(A) polymerase nucleotidyltransferase domain-containing protein n=1 Tax=Petrolisthes cinctipes TaxID=88211 RepID=A0AAE1L699_PETCI|nr:hypothetical protein Pcinc_000846 [Petrolisthes cinctipes]